MFFVTAALALSASSFAQAAGPAGGPPAIGAGSGAKQKAAAGAQKKIQEVLKSLDLTDDQKTKLKPFVKSYTDALKAIRDDVKDNKITRKDAAPKMKEAQEDFRKNLKTILTDDQWKKFEEATKPADKKKKKDGGR